MNNISDVKYMNLFGKQNYYKIKQEMSALFNTLINQSN